MDSIKVNDKTHEIIMLAYKQKELADRTLDIVASVLGVTNNAVYNPKLKQWEQENK